jgi:hypothetical protein
MRHSPDVDEFVRTRALRKYNKQNYFHDLSTISAEIVYAIDVDMFIDAHCHLVASDFDEVI